MKKLNFSQIKKYIETIGWRLLSDEYVDSRSVLSCMCQQGHNVQITWNRIQRGQSCAECNRLKKKTIEEVKAVLEERGWKLSSTEYVSCRKPINVECSNGHRIQMPWSSIRKNNSCPVCFGNAKKTTEQIKAFAESIGYELLEEYRNSHSKLSFRCPLGHVSKISPTNLKAGKRCPICREHVSQQIVRGFLEKHTGFRWKTIRPAWLNFRNSSDSRFNLEIDCWCEELQTGVEVNGKQHYAFPNHCHKTAGQFAKQRERDLFKIEACRKLGKILLIVKALDGYGYSEGKMLADLGNQLRSAGVV